MSISFVSRTWKRRRWRCKRLPASHRVTDRQERIAGWDQLLLACRRALGVGAGAAIGHVAQGLVRKGIGELHICDFDSVSPTDLPRQLFYKRDLFQNKAIRLCRNLSREGVLGTSLIAHPCAFQELDLDIIVPGLMVCGVDVQRPGTRMDVARACRQRGIACVYIAVSTNADSGYVFVDEPGKACWACALKPEQSAADDDPEQQRCPGVPASIDIIKVLAGHALYAMDTLVMRRPRDWNFRTVSLSRSDFGGSQTVEPRIDCPLCGKNRASETVGHPDGGGP